MDGGLKFDYYYGAEAEQFSFYRVPRLLIKDRRFKGLSSDAKLLYGLMLDRMALSISVQKDTLAKLIVVSEINGVELEELIHTILEKGIEEHGSYE